MGFKGWGQAVQGIPEDGMTNRGEMGADLVRIASGRAGFDQAKPLILLQNTDLGVGGLAGSRVDDRAVAAVAIDAQRRVDTELACGGGANT